MSEAHALSCAADLTRAAAAFRAQREGKEIVREVIADPSIVAALEARVAALESALVDHVNRLSDDMAASLRSMHDQAMSSQSRIEKIDGTLMHIASILPKAA